MENLTKKVLTVQDISCVGQCSTTVALPIISCLGLETSPLPTSLLSNHTTGFGDYSHLDLTNEDKLILDKFVSKNIKFDCVYTGYIGSVEQIEMISLCVDSILNDGGTLIVDPVMGDDGKLYPDFDKKYVDAMIGLTKKADIIIPNLTEASLLLGENYEENYSREKIEHIVKELNKMTNASVILTGVSLIEGNIGACILNKETNKISYYFTQKIGGSHNGTGDVFASVITGLVTRGVAIEKATIMACNFVADCMKATEIEHWYGVRFELCLNKLLNKIENGNF